MDAEDPKVPEGHVDAIGTITVPFADNFIYSNCSALATSQVDVRIGFGEVSVDGKVTSKAGIVMPPEHAVQLVMNLMQQMVYFEKKIGPIRNPAWQAFRARAEAEMETPQSPTAPAPPSQE
jgi:hypothetical protein